MPELISTDAAPIATLAPVAFDTENLDAPHWKLEIDRAREFRKKHTVKCDKLDQWVAGNFYRSDTETDIIPENFLFSYQAFMLPELCYSPPECRVRTKRPTAFKPVADSIESVLNTWVKSTDFPDNLELAVQDSLAGYGIIKVGMEDDPNSNGLRPFAQWRRRSEFLIDPACDTPALAKWMGDEYEVQLADLQRDPRLDPEAVGKLMTKTGQNNRNPEATITHGETPPRKTVRLFDVWIRKGNQIGTLAMTFEGEVQATWVRKPQPFWGPATGPYVVFGLYRVSGDPYPLGPLQAIAQQFEEIRAHQKAGAEEAAAEKSLVLVDSESEDAYKAIINSPNGAAVQIKGLAQSGKVLPISIGGMSASRANYIEQTRQRMDRTIGFTDAQRGRATAGTATEASILQANSDLRTEWMRKQVLKRTRDVLNIVAWYLLNDSAVAMDVKITDPVTGMVREGRYLGGPQSGVDVWGNPHDAEVEQKLTLESFELEIEPTSMQRSDNAAEQTRTLQLIDVVMKVLQAQQLFPMANWRALLDMYGQNSLNQANISEIILQIGAPGMMQGMQPGMPQQGPMGAPVGPPPGAMPMQGMPMAATPGMPPMQQNIAMGMQPQPMMQ